MSTLSFAQWCKTNKIVGISREIIVGSNARVVRALPKGKSVEDAYCLVLSKTLAATLGDSKDIKPLADTFVFEGTNAHGEQRLYLGRKQEDFVSLDVLFGK